MSVEEVRDLRGTIHRSPGGVAGYAESKIWTNFRDVLEPPSPSKSLI